MGKPTETVAVWCASQDEASEFKKDDDDDDDDIERDRYLILSYVF